MTLSVHDLPRNTFAPSTTVPPKMATVGGVDDSPVMDGVAPSTSTMTRLDFTLLEPVATRTNRYFVDLLLPLGGRSTENETAPPAQFDTRGRPDTAGLTMRAQLDAPETDASSVTGPPPDASVVGVAANPPIVGDVEVPLATVGSDEPRELAANRNVRSVRVRPLDVIKRIARPLLLARVKVGEAGFVSGRIAWWPAAPTRWIGRNVPPAMRALAAKTTRKKWERIPPRLSASMRSGLVRAFHCVKRLARS